MLANELKKSLFHPYLLPVNFITSLIGFGLIKSREYYVRKKFQQDSLLNKILQDITANALLQGIKINPDIKIYIIHETNINQISKLFENFNQQKHIHNHFNTIIVESDYINNTSYQDLKKTITEHILTISLNKPIIDYFLYKSINFILVAIIITAKQLLVITNPVLIGLTASYIIGLIIIAIIKKIMDSKLLQKINNIINNHEWDRTNTNQKAMAVISNSSSPVVATIIPKIIVVPENKLTHQANNTETIPALPASNHLSI